MINTFDEEHSTTIIGSETMKFAIYFMRHVLKTKLLLIQPPESTVANQRQLSMTQPLFHEALDFSTKAEFLTAHRQYVLAVLEKAEKNPLTAAKCARKRAMPPLPNHDGQKYRTKDAGDWLRAMEALGLGKVEMSSRGAISFKRFQYEDLCHTVQEELEGIGIGAGYQRFKKSRSE